MTSRPPPRPLTCAVSVINSDNSTSLIASLDNGHMSMSSTLKNDPRTSFLRLDFRVYQTLAYPAAGLLGA